jgi:hypothetical protein
MPMSSSQIRMWQSMLRRAPCREECISRQKPRGVPVWILSRKRLGRSRIGIVPQEIAIKGTVPILSG